METAERANHAPLRAGAGEMEMQVLSVQSEATTAEGEHAKSILIG